MTLTDHTPDIDDQDYMDGAEPMFAPTAFQTCCVCDEATEDLLWSDDYPGYYCPEHFLALPEPEEEE